MINVTNDPEVDFKKLSRLLNLAKSQPELYKTIVNAPFKQKVEMAFLFVGIIALLRVDEDNSTVYSVAVSDTEFAKDVSYVSPLPFEEIRIPLKTGDNIIAKAIHTGKPQDTTDWNFLLNPALDAQAAQFNQVSAGIAYSAVYPLRAKADGALIFSYFQYAQDIGEPQRDFMAKYAALVDKALSS